MVRTLAPLALAAALLTGCAVSSHPRINDIKYNPGRYQNHTVTVDGVVTSSWGVPLVPIKLYKVDDGTGEVTVVAHDGRAPSKGSRVSVKGRVNDVAAFGGQSIGLHIEQEHLKFKY
jgi:DNA/RNA endonuclease YhcR with UshA esterase domain